MEEPSQTILEISNRVGRIEGRLEGMQASLDRIEKRYEEVDKLNKSVAQHSILFKGLFVFIGIVVSFFTTKMLGKF